MGRFKAAESSWPYGRRRLSRPPCRRVRPPARRPSQRESRPAGPLGCRRRSAAVRLRTRQQACSAGARQAGEVGWRGWLSGPGAGWPWLAAAPAGWATMGERVRRAGRPADGQRVGLAANPAGRERQPATTVRSSSAAAQPAPCPADTVRHACPGISGVAPRARTAGEPSSAPPQRTIPAEARTRRT